MTPKEFHNIVRNTVQLTVEMIDDPSVFIAPSFIRMCSPQKFDWDSIVVNYCNTIRELRPFFRWMPVNSCTWFDHYASNCDNHEILLYSDRFNEFVAMFSLSCTDVVKFGPFIGTSNHEVALKFVVGVINAASLIANWDAYLMTRTLALSSDQAIANYLAEVQRTAIEDSNSKQRSGDNSYLMSFYESLPCIVDEEADRCEVFVPSKSELELLEERLKRELMFVSQLRHIPPLPGREEVQASFQITGEGAEEPESSTEHEKELPPCPLTIDSKTRKASIRGEAIDGQLTPMQIKLLEAFIQSWPNRLSKDELLSIEGVGDPLGVFKRLIENEPWNKLFSTAGKERNKYGWRPELLS